MERILKKSLFGIFFVVLFFAGCKNELLPYPGDFAGTDGNISVIGQVTAPTDVLASSGQKRKIVLSWQAQQDATRYFIYAASTPFDAFVKIAESSETRYEYPAVSGVTRYFKVSAVDYKNNESLLSLTVKGTTLASPILSDIQSTEENGDLKSEIYWYMENVEDYQEQVRYNVNCYLNNQLVQTKVVDGSVTSSTSVVFGGLKPNTNYFYEVEAYIVSSQDDVETSDRMDETTVASMRPGAVENLTASQGTFGSRIELRFTLPEKSFVSKSDSLGTSFEEYPLYFKIYRRVSGDEKWETLVEHLYYDGTTTGGSSSSYFANYKADSVVVWNDNVESSGLLRGVKYEYKIQSYVDNYSKTVTSESSVSLAEGWAYPNVQVKIPKLVYSFNQDKSKKTGGDISYAVVWDNLGAENRFKFILKTRYEYEENSVVKARDEKNRLFDTLASLNEFVLNLDIEKSSVFGGVGNYYHEFYLIPSSGDENFDLTKAFEKVIVPGKIHVSQDPAEPYFPGARILDGYKDKIIVEWDAESDNLDYTVMNGSTVVGTVKSSEYEYGSGEKIRVEIGGLESGKSYSYILQAKRTDESEVFSCNDDLTGYTLGVPSLIFDQSKLCHDKIHLDWNPVQKAENYKVYFDGKLVSEFSKSDYADKLGKIHYSYTVPDASDASISGKIRNMKVVASNDLDSTEENKGVYLLGPAATHPTVDVASSESQIVLTWKKVDGALKYCIRRSISDAKNINNSTSVDVYTVDASGELLEKSSYNNCVSVSYSDGVYTLVDKKMKAVDKTSKWQKNQEKLGWGLPIRYSVYPMRDQTFESEVDEGQIFDTIEDINYKNTNDLTINPVGSCIGYGHNVHASKSESPDKIYISYDPQYLGNKTLTPYLMVRKHEKDIVNESERLDYVKIVDSRVERYSEKNVFIYKPAPGERTDSFDFMVSYSPAVTPVIEDAFAEYVRDGFVDPLTKDKKLKEPMNKGYAFAVNLRTDNGVGEDGLSESFYWNLWDEREKALGPDSDSKYIFAIKNLDFGPNWITLAEIGLDGTIVDKITPDLNIRATTNGAKLNNGYTIRPVSLDAVKPESMRGVDYYDGLLKVLRDYRHFAKIEVKRNMDEENSISMKKGFVEESTVVASYADDAENCFGCRQITDVEFARAVNLVIADAVYQAGIDGGGDRYCYGQIETEGVEPTKFRVTHNKSSKDGSWGCGNADYKHIFRGGTKDNSSALNSAFVLKIPSTPKTEFIMDVNTLYCLPELTITVEHSSRLSSYSGTVTFSVGESKRKDLVWCTLSHILTFKKNGTVIKEITSSNENEFKKWFPYTLGESHDKGIKEYNESAVVYNSNYGWW